MVGEQNADIAYTLHLFSVSTGYNFGMIASDTLFDFRGEPLGSSYPMKT